MTTRAVIDVLASCGVEPALSWGVSDMCHDNALKKSLQTVLQYQIPWKEIEIRNNKKQTL